ncbi:TetR/AcrR family transcriptional regulator [Caldimonas sp. KR1-144]|uniref:TetR/AcrR family transcriptional regulator n=1 Tax=Caldimonas sp. KR1-144 TaxID=3400911 RepID=UPI003C035CE1
MATDSPTRKEETHDRIVRTAARAIRQHGYDGLGVASLMKEAGLTHGGFYAHFGSKTDLLAEAADRAGAEGIEGLGRLLAAAQPAAALDTLIDAYLSDAHLAAPEQGCAIAALGSEVPRQAEPVRRAATQRMKEMADLVERQLPGWRRPGNDERALAILSCLVGAMVIARASDDPAFSTAVRQAAGKLARQAAL